MFDNEEIILMFQSEENITSTARKYCEKYGIEYNDNIRRTFSRIINGGENTVSSTTDSVNYNNDKEKTVHFSAVSGTGDLMNIDEYCEKYDLDRDSIRSFKLITHTGTPYYNIVFYDNIGNKEEGNNFAKDLLESISSISTLPKTIVRTQEEVNSDRHLLVIDPCDIHIGKLCDSFEVGEDYNNQIAVQRVKEGVQGIIDKSKGFNIEKILFVGGNDVLHVDNPRNTTTSGTPQDVCGMWYSNFLVAKKLYIEIIDMLLEVADVHFVYNPSNHDYMSSFFLADVIRTYYKDCDNITFDCDMAHRKYFRYYNNLIGTTHGDGAKQADLPLLMAHESPDWSNVKHRYIYGHHVHHKIAKDYIGVTFETLRSPSGTDSWHHRNGYTGVPKAVEGFIHHAEFGQVARFSQIF